MEAQDTPTPWNDFGELLRWIGAIFGAAFNALEALTPKTAKNAGRWLRAAEAFARVLLLERAKTVTLAPVRAASRQRVHAASAPSGRGLFSFAHGARGKTRAPVYRPRREMTEEEALEWSFFGGRERAAEVRALRRAQSGGAVSRNAHTQRRSDAFLPAPDAPPAAAPSHTPFAARYARLLRVLDAPDAAARRLKRRLTANAALARRAIVGAMPRESWRTGYEATIAQQAQIAGALWADSS